MLRALEYESNRLQTDPIIVQKYNSTPNVQNLRSWNNPEFRCKNGYIPLTMEIF